MIPWRGALVVSLAVIGASGAEAEPITLAGLTFSDELGGVRLERGWGSGSLDDPQFTNFRTFTDGTGGTNVALEYSITGTDAPDMLNAAGGGTVHGLGANDTVIGVSHFR